MIMSGSRPATLRQVQVVDIHGTHLYDLVYMHDDEPGKLRRARLGSEAVYAGLQAGDAIDVSYMMGVATGVERR